MVAGKQGFGQLQTIRVGVAGVLLSSAEILSRPVRATRAQVAVAARRPVDRRIACRFSRAECTTVLTAAKKGTTPITIASTTERRREASIQSILSDAAPLSEPRFRYTECPDAGHGKRGDVIGERVDVRRVSLALRPNRTDTDWESRRLSAPGCWPPIASRGRRRSRTEQLGDQARQVLDPRP